MTEHEDTLTARLLGMASRFPEGSQAQDDLRQAVVAVIRQNTLSKAIRISRQTDSDEDAPAEPLDREAIDKAMFALSFIAAWAGAKTLSTFRKVREYAKHNLQIVEHTKHKPALSSEHQIEVLEAHKQGYELGLRQVKAPPSDSPRPIGKIVVGSDGHPRAVLSTAYGQNGNRWKNGTPFYDQPSGSQAEVSDTEFSDKAVQAALTEWLDGDAERSLFESMRAAIKAATKAQEN